MTVSTRYKIFGLAAATALGIAMSASYATPPKHGYGKRPSGGVNVVGPRVNVNGPNIHGPKNRINGPVIKGPSTRINGPIVNGPTIKLNGPVVKGPTVKVTGPTVGAPIVKITGPNVTGPTFIDAGAFAGAFASASAGTTVFAGGGGFVSGAAPVAQSSTGQLNIAGAEEFYYETVTERVPTTRETCIENVGIIDTLRPVRAVCIDDKNVPHPASQLNGERGVAASYNGEIFRCVAGTYMQVSLGRMVNGEISWDHGESFSCRKGEALVHRSGGGLVCATQKPQRDCNERSLLRRYKTGIKLVHARQEHKTCERGTETVYETVTREVKRKKESSSIAGGLVLDGGVGQTVF